MTHRLAAADITSVHGTDSSMPEPGQTERINTRPRSEPNGTRGAERHPKPELGLLVVTVTLTAAARVVLHAT